MVNSEAFLKKAEALKSSNFIGSFQDLPNYPVLNDDTAKKVAEAAGSELREFFDQNPSFRSVESRTRWLRQTQIRFDKYLGSGSFSSVYQIKTIRSEDYKIYRAHDLVVKVLLPEMAKKPISLASRIAGLAKEGYILAKLQHDHILDVEAWPPTGIAGISSGRLDSFFLVLPRLENTLSDRLKIWLEDSRRSLFLTRKRNQKRGLLWQDRLGVLLPLADALRHLYEANIIHRDIKPANIGFTQAGVLKLYDFDMARIIPCATIPDETFSLTGCVGSMRYQSPECGMDENYNCKSDMYAFALVCHYVITLEKPYAKIPPADHYELVFGSGMRPEIPSWFSDNLAELITSGWARDLAVRPTMTHMYEQLLQIVPDMISEGESKNARSGNFSLRRLPRQIYRAIKKYGRR